MTITPQRIREFDVWREGYSGKTVYIYVGNTTTLANVYTDTDLTQAADNPQILDHKEINGRTYGKFEVPLYTASTYRIVVDNEQTGINRNPIVSLKDEDAAYAVTKTARGSRDRRLIDRFNDVVHALDFGELGTSSATNNATLTAAIGAATGQGGGDVIVPSGTYAFTTITLPVNVRLRGQGRKATVLQSEEADNVITLSGDRAGLADLTLDGINLNVGSVGVYGVDIEEIRFENFEIKRFETGLHLKGGDRAAWREFFIDNCDTGAKLHGDTDSGDSGNGSACTNALWLGGQVSQCTVIGVDLSYEDTHCRGHVLDTIHFKDNTGIALNVNGARNIELRHPFFTGNTTDMDVHDDTDTSQSDNTVVSLHVKGGSVDSGILKFDDTCQDVVFEHMRIAGVTWNLLNVTNPILIKDSVEDASTTVSGDGTKLSRFREIQEGKVTGTTTDATATTAWSLELDPGQVVHLDLVAIGVQQNDEKVAVYKKQAKFQRPGSTLNYDAQTANFTLGETVTGGTSGATGVIVADSDSGSTGTLTLISISGVFENNETITDGSGGSATVNGTLGQQDVSILGSVEDYGTDYEDVAGWNVTMDASIGEVRVRVTGAASDTVVWSVQVKMVSG